MTTKKLTKFAFIIASYVGLSIVLSVYSFGTVQLRIAEMLMVLCLFEKENIIPLTIACFLTNLIGVIVGSNPMPLDILFGTLATFISCLLVYRFRNKVWLALLMPVFVNAIIVGAELAFFSIIEFDLVFFLQLYGVFMIMVALGELAGCFLFGLALYKPIKDVYMKISKRV